MSHSIVSSFPENGLTSGKVRLLLLGVVLPHLSVGKTFVRFCLVWPA